MAILANQEDEQNPTGPQQAGGVGAGGPATVGSQSAFSSAPASGGASPPGAANGGSGGFTNIQDYLLANQGNDSSANMLNNAVGGAFSKDQSGLESGASTAKSQADAQVSGQMTDPQASQDINTASGLYSYNGPQSSQFTQDIAPVQSALTSSYGGPTDFSYGLSQNTQNYGSELGNDNQFYGGIMSGLYNQAAGGALGSGAMNLQQQLDTDNQPMNSARSALQTQYGNLTGEDKSLTDSTNAAIQADQKQYGVNQAGLLSYLTGQGTNAKGDIDQAVSKSNPFLNALPGDLQGAGVLPDLYPGENPAEPDRLQYSITGTPSINESNVQGVGNIRNVYNTIQSALGLDGQIGQQGDPYNLDSIMINTSHSLPGGPIGSETLSSLLPAIQSGDPWAYSMGQSLGLFPGTAGVGAPNAIKPPGPDTMT